MRTHLPCLVCGPHGNPSGVIGVRRMFLMEAGNPLEGWLFCSARCAVDYKESQLRGHDGTARQHVWRGDQMCARLAGSIPR